MIFVGLCSSSSFLISTKQKKTRLNRDLITDLITVEVCQGKRTGLKRVYTSNLSEFPIKITWLFVYFISLAALAVSV